MSADAHRRLSTLCPAWAPARERLTARISRYDDAQCRHVIACFDALADVAAHAADAHLGRIADALAAAARAVTFGETAADRRSPGHDRAEGPVPSRPEGPLLPAPIAPAVEPWADTLDTAVREILFAADTQAYFDARGNAACYRRAARHLVRAADVQPD